MAKWRRVAGAGLLALLLAGVAAPAAAVLASDPCCHGMAAERGDASPTRCQWITATSWCDEATWVGPAGSLAPAPRTACALADVQPPLQRHPIRLPAPAPNPQAAALATIVLRL